MSTLSTKDLSEALYGYIVKVLKQSNPYATKESISRKVLQECAEILNVDINCYTNKNIMYIHPDNMDKIDLKWQQLIEQGAKIMHEEHNTYKLLKSSDFANILDVQKFIGILFSKNNALFIAELLAMDGFQGLTDYKNYVENLKFGDKCADHVNVIRDVYHKFNVPVKVVYYALIKIFESYTHDEELQKYIATTIDKLAPEMAEYDLVPIMEFYENAIHSKSLELKSIALIKLAQLKNLKKKSKSVKPKVKNPPKEKKKRKISQVSQDEEADD